MGLLMCLDINLQHCKAASANLVLRLDRYDDYICFIQEPWIRGNKICGLNNTGKIFKSSVETDAPRACMITSLSVQSWQLTNFCNRDQVAILIKLEIDEVSRDVVFCSKYMPYDSDHDPPDVLFIDLINHCTANNLALVVGSDTNAHHCAWGSTDTNNRGQSLMDYLNTTNIIPINIGNKPTFQNYRRSEVLDVTMASLNIIDSISDWKVLDEMTFSDHKYITFIISSNLSIKPLKSRHPQKTNWDVFSKHLYFLLQREQVPHLNSVESIDTIVTKLNNCMTSAFEKACPLTRPKRKKSKPWWNNNLKNLRQVARRTNRRAFVTGLPGDIECAREAKIDYRNELRKSKRESWSLFCEQANGMDSMAKMNKILKTQEFHQIGMLQKDDGTYTTTPLESISLLADTHFSDSALPALDEVTVVTHSEIINKFINRERVLAAINLFRPYKTPGTDGIFPIMLQRAPSIVIALLINIFRVCISHAYTPKAWRVSRVIFIPKPNKASYNVAKSFRPISLTSFTFKTLERLIKQYLDEEVLTRDPFKGYQMAFRPGVGTDTALHNIVTNIEKSLFCGNFTLGVFLDIEGAFDNATYQSIQTSLEGRDIDQAVQGWMTNMLKNREICIEMRGVKITKKLNKGVPQGGILSPTLWNFILEDLLVTLKNSPVFTQGYADDIALLLNGCNPGILVNYMNNTLQQITNWGNKMHLNFNPSKSISIMFTNKRAWKNVTNNVVLNGQELEFQETVKYLDITLDSKLNWSKQINNIVTKANIALHRCRRTLGSTWGLSPKTMHWMYTAIIRPIVSYGSIVWITSLNKKYVIKKLNKIQRTAALSISSARHSSANDALNIILDIEPIKEFLLSVAIKSYHRMIHAPDYLPIIIPNILTQALTRGHIGTLHKYIDNYKTFFMPVDKCLPSYHYDRRYKISLQEWPADRPTSPSEILCFTDGSRLDDQSGAGAIITFPNNNIKVLKLPLGQYPTVFQSEVIAIDQTARFIEERDIRGRNINIVTDSQAALMALRNPISTSKIINECKEALSLISINNQISLQWIRGHTGHPGNEAADKLAKEGARSSFTGPEPSLPIPNCIIKEEIKAQMRKVISRKWRESNDCKHTKIFIPDVTNKISKIILSSKRQTCREYMALITGHCALNKFEFQCNRADTPLCHKCNEADETPFHLLCECPALERKRFLIFGYLTLYKEQVSNLNIHTCLRFLRTECTLTT